MKKTLTHLIQKSKNKVKYLGVFAGIFMMQQTFATDYPVTNTNDAGVGSFRQAVTDANAAAASGPHTISFTIPAASNIVLSTTTATDIAINFNADITVNAPAGGIIFTKTATVMRFALISAPRNVVFNNITIDGFAPQSNQNGGGILVNGKLTMNNCVVQNCIGLSNGKAIAIDGANSELTLTGCLIKNNGGSAAGAGIIQARSGSKITFTSSIFENNNADGLAIGGTIYFNSTTAGSIIEKCIIRNNKSDGGAGIYVQNGPLTVNNCEISGNISTARGGGIGMNGTAGAILTLTNSTISGNTALQGGGIYIYNPAQYTITNCTISGNTGTQNSAGMGTGSFGTLTNCTFSLNNCSSTTAGVVGGFRAENNIPSINYCLFVGNITSASDAAIKANASGTVTSSSGGNVVGGSTSDLAYSGGVTTGNIKTNIAASSILSPTLADNGGPALPVGGATKTHALVTGSPAIDIAGAAYVLATDQRGGLRDATEDAGSFEFNATLPVAFNKDFKASIDGNRTKLGWSVSSETNNNYFLIEKSLDGKTYAAVTKVTSKGSSANSYVAFDSQPASGVNYYRLSQVDLDGTSTMLSVKSVKFALGNEVKVSVYPNPTTDQIFVNLDNYSQAVSIGLTDSSGKTIYSEKVNGGLTNYQLKLNNKLASGIYILSLSGDGLSEVKKVIVR